MTLTEEWRALQQRMHALGFDPGPIDGDPGRSTAAGFGKALDKLAGFLTAPGGGGIPVMPAVPDKDTKAGVNAKFDMGSAKRLTDAHPMLQRLMNMARQKVVFSVLDSQRGRAAQELAFKRKTSKAHFGQSAHNWSPSVAVDIVPAASPNMVDWDNLAAFKNMGKIVMETAKELGIPVRWLGDPNMDGSPADGWDFPHFELHPWREFAKKSKPYGG